MEYRSLGRTNVQVSLAGLGSGGSSRLGQRYKLAQAEITALVRRALDLGVTMFDTAPAYGDSETLLGQALAGVPRDSYVLATKFQPVEAGSRVREPEALRRSLEDSLRRLRTDHVDVLYLHGVAPAWYGPVRETLLPALTAARDAGLVRFLGITEQYAVDHRHEALQLALHDGDYDVVMVGYNLLSPSAVLSVLPEAARRGIGVVVMCAVRTVLVDPDAVRAIVRGWKEAGLLRPDAVADEAPLDWLLDDGIRSVADAAYTFAAAQTAVGSVLTGTANQAHLEANLRAILGPRLPAEKARRVLDVFGPVQRNVQPAASGR